MTRGKWAELASVTVLLIAWEIVPSALGISETSLPPASAVLAEAVENHALLLKHALISAEATVWGFVIALLAATTLGTASALSEGLRRFAHPIVIFSQVTPKVALAPVIFLWLGEAAAKPMLAGLIAFFPLLSAVDTGLRSFDPDLEELFRSMKATRSQLFFRLQIPSCIPIVLAAARVSYIYSVIGVITVEFFRPESGLGYLMTVASQELEYPQMYAAVLACSAIGWIGWSVLGILESHLLHRYAQHTALISAM